MTLKEYLSGNKRGKAVNQFEQNSLDDPFMRDAIDGFDAVAGDHLKEIEALEKKGVNTRKSNILSAKFYITSLAATLALLLGIGTLYLNLSHHGPVQPAMQTTQKQKERIDSTLASSRGSNTIFEKRNAVGKIALSKHVNNKNQDTTKIDIQSSTRIDEPLTLSSAVFNDQNYYDHENKSEEKQQPQAAVRMPDKVAKGYIHGVILDENGDPLPGASIACKGAKGNSTVANINGQFILKTEGNTQPEIVINYVGYKSRTLIASPDSNLIALEPCQLLSEVVVVGYGTHQKAQLLPNASPKNGAMKTEATSRGLQSFGEEEFKASFFKKHPKCPCESVNASIIVRFNIDHDGKPQQIIVDESTCNELKSLVVSALSNSPFWTKTNRTIKLTIRY